MKSPVVMSHVDALLSRVTILHLCKRGCQDLVILKLGAGGSPVGLVVPAPSLIHGQR